MTTLDTLSALASETDIQTIRDCAERWGARTVLAANQDEYLAVVIAHDHVFAAASSKVSYNEAVASLASRIRAKYA